MTARPARPGAQQRMLTRAFLASFFDNDQTAGAHDRKESFIWMMGLLAAPGFIFPFILAGASWGIVGLMAGFEAIRDITRDVKVLYLGFAMLGTGLVSAMAWSHLLVDRRDALILGVLPVRPATITTARLVAVLMYVVVVAAVMHVPAALAFGGLLAAGSLRLALLGAAAHFVAAFLASLFVLLSVTSAQALIVLVAGPRRASRVSAGLQVTFVATMLVLMLSIPGMGTAVKDELHGAEARYTQSGIRVFVPEPVQVTRLSPWLEAAPPVWFFGVYELLLGSDQPVVSALAVRAVAGIGIVAGVTLIGFPLACRRLLVGAVSDPGGFARTGRLSAVAEWLTRAASAEPTGRAAIQLLLTTAARVPRHRFIAAAAIGAALAVVIPVALAPSAIGAPTASSSVPLLGLPFYISTFLLVGLRFVIRTPGELQAGWILAVADVPARVIEAALWRAFLAVGVVPWVVLFTPVYWWLWGPRLAIVQALLVAATGVLFSTVLLFRWAAMPCAERMAPLDQGRIGRQVVLALAALLWLAAMPTLSPELATHPIALGIVLGFIALAVLVVRFADRQLKRLPRQNLFESDTAFQTLGLD